VASEIAVALISGGVGLTTGIVGSLIAPWANWGVEKRRLRQESRVERIGEWRDGVEALRAAENDHVPRIGVPGMQTSLVVDNGAPDPDGTRLRSRSWFVTLQPELSKRGREEAVDLQEQRVVKRLGLLPDLLAAEIARIERDKWKLI
jgi:hypothetical protein